MKTLESFVVDFFCFDHNVSQRMHKGTNRKLYFMKRYHFTLVLLIALLGACSSGKKALNKGDYFAAVSKSINRLDSNPGNDKALQVLKKSYPLAIKWSQEEIDLNLSGNGPFKWDRTVAVMEQVNTIAQQIRRNPVARESIASIKVYTSEITMAKEKAADERYKAGVVQLQKNNREDAKDAFYLFLRAGELVPNYKDTQQKLDEAKEMATTKVVLEAVPVFSKRYKVTAEFFYNQVFQYLNEKFPEERFVNFYSPDEAEHAKLDYPDFVVRLEFFDFMVGQTNHYEKEENLTKRVQVETKDTSRVVYKTYKTKFKLFTDKVTSGGLLDVSITDFNSKKLVLDTKVPGEFVWMNEYAMYVGDYEALNDTQKQLAQQKVQPLPPAQDLFIEFTHPIYDQVTNRLYRFFKKYD